MSNNSFNAPYSPYTSKSSSNYYGQHSPAAGAGAAPGSPALNSANFASLTLSSPPPPSPAPAVRTTSGGAGAVSSSGQQQQSRGSLPPGSPGLGSGDSVQRSTTNTDPYSDTMTLFDADKTISEQQVLMAAGSSAGGNSNNSGGGAGTPGSPSAPRGGSSAGSDGKADSKPGKGDEKSGPPEIFASVPLSEFSSHVKKQQSLIDDSFDHFDIEMEVLQQMALQPQFLKRIFVPNNKSVIGKNRYGNVLPHEETRVRLAKLSHDPTSDYINASHITPTLEGAKARYIAASAPLPVTFNDWWRMVWEQEGQMVVMLTREKEKDKVTNRFEIKAHRYWPDKGSQQYGDITVTCNENDPGKTDGDTIIRNFILKKDNEERPCMVIQYVGWPDHGVPEKYESFVHLFEIYREERDKLLAKQAEEKVKKLQSPMTRADSSSSSSSPSSATAGSASAPHVSSPSDHKTLRHLSDKEFRDRARWGPPIITHCSAGIGRTGTFIGLDMIIDYIRDFNAKHNTKAESAMSDAAGATGTAVAKQPAINVFSVVKSLRDQRPGMVQSKQQYAFCSLFLDHIIQNRKFGL